MTCLSLLYRTHPGLEILHDKQPEALHLTPESVNLAGRVKSSFLHSDFYRCVVFGRALLFQVCCPRLVVNPQIRSTTDICIDNLGD